MARQVFLPSEALLACLDGADELRRVVMLAEELNLLGSDWGHEARWNGCAIHQ